LWWRTICSYCAFPPRPSRDPHICCTYVDTRYSLPSLKYTVVARLLTCLHLSTVWQWTGFDKRFLGIFQLASLILFFLQFLCTSRTNHFSITNRLCFTVYSTKCAIYLVGSKTVLSYIFIVGLDLRKCSADNGAAKINLLTRLFGEDWRIKLEIEVMRRFQR
jgi:hypothetical protein